MDTALATSSKKSHQLLSLDGGGIKGIASLYTLQEIMKEVQLEENSRKDQVTLTDSEKKELEQERLPVDHFDLAARTSTGGIIGILLLRLRMNTSEAIYIYEEMAAKIFSPTFQGYKVYKLRWPGYYASNGILKWKAATQPSQFSDGLLKQAIDDFVNKYSEILVGTKEEKGRLFYIIAGKL